MPERHVYDPALIAFAEQELAEAQAHYDLARERLENAQRRLAEVHRG